LDGALARRLSHRQGQIEDLEKVEIRANKLVMTVKLMSYK